MQSAAIEAARQLGIGLAGSFNRNVVGNRDEGRESALSGVTAFQQRRGQLDRADELVPYSWRPLYRHLNRALARLLRQCVASGA